jgi:integrase
MSTIWTSIGQTTLNNLPATGSVYFIRDNDLRGFGIKVTAKGQATYIAEARIKGGRTTRISLGSVNLLSLRDARADAIIQLLRIKKGEDVQRTIVEENSSHDSLRVHLNTYLETKTLAKGTSDGYRNIMNAFFKDWMTMPVEAISEKLVQDKRSMLKKRDLSEDYINRGFRTLKLILNTADLPHQNPVSKFYKKWKISLQSTNKDHFLLQDQIVEIINGFILESDAWRTSAQRPIYSFLMFLILTGCRKSEVLDLIWKDVTDETVTFIETKNHRKHVFPNIGMITDVIEQMRQYGDEAEARVFRMTYSTLRSSFDPIKTEMKFVLHDLRRTFAEHANLCGYDDNIIGLALNHKTVSFQRRTYMSGELAKTELLKEMYITFQKQLAFYLYENVQERAPDDFKSWHPKASQHLVNFLAVTEPEKFKELEL